MIVVELGEKAFFRLPSGQIVEKDKAIILLNKILLTYEGWTENQITVFNTEAAAIHERMFQKEEQLPNKRTIVVPNPKANLQNNPKNSK